MASEIAKQNRAARFNPQEIANTAWAFAKNAEGSKQLFDSLATMTLVLGAKSGGDLTRAGFTPQELSNPVWNSKLFYSAFVLNHSVDLHAIDAAPARWRGDAGTPSTRRLLDGVAMPVPHRSTQPARPRRRREIT